MLPPTVSPITSQILTRTFCIWSGEGGAGTAFGIEVGDNLCLVTAKHVVSKLTAEVDQTIGIRQGHRFVEIPVRIHNCADSEIDIAILETNLPLNPADKFSGLALYSANMIVSQDVYFLGFPFFGNMIKYQPAEINNFFPFPLVKKATFSGKSDKIMYLDGHNNPGFSGGPVVYNNLYSDVIQQRICGVISGYLDQFGKVEFLTQTPKARYRENTGIIVAHHIAHAVELIQQIYGQVPNANTVSSNNLGD